MMMFTTKMCQLTAVVLEQDVDNVTRELLREGVLHFVKLTDVTDDAGSFMTTLPLKVHQNRIIDTTKRI